MACCRGTCCEEHRPAMRPGRVACSGWHRNRHVWCTREALYAITHRDPPAGTFLRCSICARPYRRDNALAPAYGLPLRWTIERLMADPPKALVAA